MKTLIGKDICTATFIEALFTTAKTWKQPKCPSMDKEVVVYIHNEMIFSHNKSGNPTICICSNMAGLEDIILSEIRQREKDKYRIISLTCGILNNNTKKNSVKEIRLVVTRGKG